MCANVMECKFLKIRQLVLKPVALIRSQVLLPQLLSLNLFVTQGDFMGIKPGPKPIAESTGKEDKRRRVTPENKPKHPGLKEHDHKKGE